MILLTLILIPLIGAVLIIISSAKQKEIALITSSIVLLLTVSIWVLSSPLQSSYFIIENWSSLIKLGMDGTSLLFTLLTIFTIMIAILAGWYNINTRIKMYYSSLLILESILIGIFLATDILLFYIFFESSLIPMYFLIGIYGGRERKIHAAYLFFLMTLTGSFFMLFAFIYIASNLGSMNYIILSTSLNDLDSYTFLQLSDLNNDYLYKLLWLALFIAFAVKTPIIPFHIWLPEAHTEANVSGSIILAGILLKLSSYGFIRFSLGLLPITSYYYTPLIYGLSVISIIYSSVATLRQTDLKKIIAYSSIGHMSIVNIGIFSNNIVAIDGAFTLIIAHGIVSPALFILVSILYEKYHTRIIKYYRGLVINMPIFSLFFFLFTLANISVPLTGNFIGELLIFSGSFSTNSILCIFAASAIILSAGYSIWLYNRIIYGKYTKYINLSFIESNDLSRIQFNSLICLFLLIILLGLIPNVIFDLYKLNI
jgi:NADH-ubiquinone oxidoreductase chain 4